VKNPIDYNRDRNINVEKNKSNLDTFSRISKIIIKSQVFFNLNSYKILENS